MSDLGKWLDRLERSAGDDGNVDAAYRPASVLPIHITRHWHSEAVAGEDDGGESEMSASASWPPPESQEVKRERAARLAATADAIAAWVTADARAHDYRDPYHLVVWFRDADLEPERATFNVPWRGPHRRGGFSYSQVIDELTDAKGSMHWPIAGAE